MIKSKETSSGDICFFITLYRKLAFYSNEIFLIKVFMFVWSGLNKIKTHNSELRGQEEATYAAIE